jgi:serine/threonine-protein phosphatase 2A regulatory subunit B''
MRHFYRNQIHRVTSLGQESINFHDVLCQMIDMIAPEDLAAITIHDMIKPDKRMISGE